MITHYVCVVGVRDFGDAVVSRATTCGHVVDSRHHHDHHRQRYFAIRCAAHIGRNPNAISRVSSDRMSRSVAGVCERIETSKCARWVTLRIIHVVVY